MAHLTCHLQLSAFARCGSIIKEKRRKTSSFLYLFSSLLEQLSPYCPSHYSASTSFTTSPQVLYARKLPRFVAGDLAPSHAVFAFVLCAPLPFFVPSFCSLTAPSALSRFGTVHIVRRRADNPVSCIREGQGRWILRWPARLRTCLSECMLAHHGL